MAFGIVVYVSIRLLHYLTSFSFQTFMIGLFTVQTAFPLAVCTLPLLLGTIFACYRMNRTFARLGEHVNLSQAAEVTQQGSAPVVQTLKRANPVTASQMNLNRARYKHKDDNAYVVAKDAKVRFPQFCVISVQELKLQTDYSQPPLSDVYYGVLNTGRRRYGHPGLSGNLPTPWLPQQKEAENQPPFISRSEGLVLNLRRRWSIIKHAASRDEPVANSLRQKSPSVDDATRAWRDAEAENQTGNEWHAEGDDDEAETDEEEALDTSSKYKTYFAHPERRRNRLPGAFRAGSTSDSGSDS